MKNRIKKYGLAVLSVLLLQLCVFCGGAKAVSYTSYQQKALGYDLFRCYTEAQANNSWTVASDITLGNYHSLSSIVNNRPKDFAPLYTDNKSLNCQKLIGDLMSSVGLSSEYGLDDLQKASVLTSLGYKGISAGDCFRLKARVYGKDWAYDGRNEEWSYSPAICSSDGSINEGSISVIGDNPQYGIRVGLDGEKAVNVKIAVPDGEYGEINLPYPLDKGLFSDIASLRDRITQDLVTIFSNSLENDKEIIGVDLDNYQPFSTGGNYCLRFSAWGGAYSCVSAADTYDNDSIVTGYTIDNSSIGATRAGAAFTAASKLLNGSFNSRSNFQFSNEEKYALYEYYLTNFYEAKKTCADTVGGNWSLVKSGLESNGDGILVTMRSDAGGAVECYVLAQKHKRQNVNGLNSNNYFDGTQKSLSDILNETDLVAKLSTFSDEELQKAMEEVDVDPIDPNTDGDWASDNGCYSAGLDSQSWILCPTLTNMTSVVDGLDAIVGDMLSVDTSNFDNDGRTKGVWETFRNIANTIMVVILLVIIFSQLTGYGIDNYGIKKMLPKLILMAILINLSFFICQLAVDLSNILGFGLNQLFRGMANGAGDDTIGVWMSELIGIVFGGAAAGAGLISVGTTVGGMVAGASGPMIVISLIITLLVALVAVLMFFLIVGARLMIIILFTAASPVAFACYILPNTQKIFKKWWDIFKAALIVYPICGALYGLSFLIRSMVNLDGNLTLGDFPMILVAAAAPFLPFLVLPSLLKGALAGLGVVSGAITSIGNGLRKGLTRGNQALQGTDAYKRQSEDAARIRQENSMRRWLNGYQRRKGNLSDEDMSKSQRMRAARYTEALKKFESQDSAAKTVLAESEFKNALEPDLQDAWKKAYLNGSDDLDALTNVMLSRYGAGAANYMANTMDENNLVGPTGARNANIERSLGVLRNNLYSNDKNSKLLMDKTPDAHRMITTLGSNGNLRNYADNKITTKQSDVISTTSGSIERMVRYGSFNDLLGRGSAQSMLSSNEPSIVNGLTDPKKKKAVMAQAYLDSHYDGKFENAKGLTIDDLANAYAKEAEQMENTRATAEQEQRQVAQQQLEELRKLNEQLGHGSGQNDQNSGAGFSDGAGI